VITLNFEIALKGKFIHLQSMKALTSILLFILVNSNLASEPLIVAHRGASFDAPENTLPAFELAWN
jgi:glycerophosphoryl diester phosphodiesterase